MSHNYGSNRTPSLTTTISNEEHGRNRLGKARDYADRRIFGIAMSLAEEALELLSNYPSALLEVYTLQGRILNQQDRFAEAVVAMEAAASILYENQSLVNPTVLTLYLGQLEWARTNSMLDDDVAIEEFGQQVV